jgi:hypothetical protein
MVGARNGLFTLKERMVFMNTNRVLKVVVVVLLVVVVVLGCKLYKECRWNDIFFRHMTDAQTELDAIKNANASVSISNPLADYKSPEIEKQLIEAGIAERMLGRVKSQKGSSLLPPVTFGIGPCMFWVEKAGQSISLVIEMPNPDPRKWVDAPRTQELFPVVEGDGFGAADEAPLTAEQMAVIKSIVGQ